MINCTHCGTQNRDGSKFCSNCGARLIPQSGLICPMCSTANKLETVFCSNCGARLAPLIATPPPDKPQPPAPPIKGLSLPSKPYEPVEEPAIEIDWTPATPETPSKAEDEVPDWLKPAEPVEEIQPATTDEQPAWLMELSKPSDEPLSHVDEVPDWLKEPVPEVEPTPEAPPAIETESTSDWMKLIESEPVTPPADLPPATEEPVKPGEPLIEALEEQAAKPVAEDSTAWLAETPHSVEGVEDIPDWLRTDARVEKESEVGLAGWIQPALPEEVPDWIAALKPVERPLFLEDEPLETTGPLAGLRGVLPLAIAMAEPHTLPKPVPPGARKESALIFDSILAAPPTETAVAQPPRRKWSMRPLIYLLLALAVVIPFFLPSDWASSGLQINRTPTSEFYDLVQALPANSTVLLAFEYDPSVAGEMDLQAKAITRHLIQRNVKIVTLSTFDTGAPLARRILVDATQGVANYTYGTNYLNLGYLPGNEAALANLAAAGFPATTRDVQNQELGKLPSFAHLKTLRDFRMIIVLAGSDDALKAWMEQVQPRAGVPILGGVSAAVEPKARAYRDTPSRQLAAMTSGLIGAAQYETLSNPQETGLALISVNAQTAAQLLLVFIIVIGNLVHWFGRGQRQNV